MHKYGYGCTKVLPLYMKGFKDILENVVANLLIVMSIRLTLSWRRPLSYENQSINMQSKPMLWFLSDRDLRHERSNTESPGLDLLRLPIMTY